MERTLASREIFAGRLLKLRVDDVQLDNGHRTTREIVEHPGAVAIVPLTDDGQIVLVKQYRKAAERLTLELPAGTLSPGEDPSACAVRELKEETGYVASTLEHVSSFYSAIGFCTEVLHLFTATGLEPGDQAYEEDENIEVMTVPVASAMELVRDGSIADSKTVAGVFWARLALAGDAAANGLRQGRTA